MAKQPECLQRRKFLYSSDVSPEKLSEMGRAAEKEGFLSDAIDFFDRARDLEGLNRILDRAVEEGDFFLATRVEKAGGETISGDRLEKLAQNAERLGKAVCAEQARQKSEIWAVNRDPNQTEA